MGVFKGTKGKWLVKHSETKDAFNVVGTEISSKYKIARCPYPADSKLPIELNERERSEAFANAKLIAAAPDLLEALQAIANYWRTAQSTSLSLIDHINKSLDVAEKAIKKATE